MSPTYQLIDRELNGTLALHLRTMRAEGLSFDNIAVGLKDYGGVSINGNTVARWCKELGITDKQKAAS